MLKKIVLALVMVAMTASFAFAQKSIVIAHDATWPPMEFVDANKNIVGYSVDYCDAIAKEVGITVEHKSVAWDGIFAGLVGRKYDMISSSVSITPERQKKFDFSDPYFEVTQAVILPADASGASLADLKGKTLGGQIGTTGVFMAKRAEGVNTKEYDEIGFAVEALYTGRIDGVICDDAIAADYVLRNKKYAGKFKLAFIVKSDKPEYYGFVVKKGNKELLDLLNKGIKAVKAKGIEAELRKKWIGQ